MFLSYPRDGQGAMSGSAIRARGRMEACQREAGIGATTGFGRGNGGTQAWDTGELGPVLVVAGLASGEGRAGWEDHRQDCGEGLDCRQYSQMRAWVSVGGLRRKKMQLGGQISSSY
jgi:hypothetical protein